MERVTCEDVQEMARRQDKDFIDSLNMIGEGAPNYPGVEQEKEQVQCRIEDRRSVS